MTNIGEIRRRMDFSSVCDGNTLKLLTSHVQAVGVPKEYVLFPLLSTVSACIGGSTVKINEEWNEQCCLWTAVVARKGSRRSTMLGRYMEAMSSAKDHAKVDVSCCKELSSEMFHSGKPHLRLFEDLGSSNLLHASIQQPAKTGYDNLPYQLEGRQGAPNIFSFLPPDDSLALLNDKNIDLISRFLVACPKSTIFKSADLRSPMPSNTPSLVQIFEVLLEVHTQPMTYTMDTRAKQAFDAYYDMLQDGMVRFNRDEKIYCILAKAAGQLARLSAVLSALRQALKIVVYHEKVLPTNWNVEITYEDLAAGKKIMDYAIDIRFTLLNKASSFRAQQVTASRRAGTPQTVNCGPAPICPRPQPSSEDIEPDIKRARATSTNTEMLSINQSNSGEVIFPNEKSQFHGLSAEKPKQVQATQVPERSTAFAPSSADMPQSSNGTNHQPPCDADVYPQADAVSPGFFSNKGVEPEKYYQPGRRNSGYVDCTMLTETDLVGYDEDQQRFIRRFGYKLKKLLSYSTEYRISPSCCAQRHLMPAIPKSEMARYDTHTRYPVAAAREYLTKAAELGLGLIESTWHATNNRRSLVFQKFTFDKLGSAAKNLLVKLHVEVDDYMAAFTAPPEEFCDVVPPNSGEMIPRQKSPTVSSSSALSYPVPYTYLQRQPVDTQSRILTITPEAADHGDSSESSQPTSESDVSGGLFLKTEPNEDSASV